MLSASRLHSNTKKAHKKLKSKVVADDAAPPKTSPKQGNYLLPGAAADANPTATTTHARHPGQVSILARDFPTKGSPAGMPKELFPFLTREDWGVHFAQLGAALSRNKRMLCCGRAEAELVEEAFGPLDAAKGLRTTVATHGSGIQITIYFHT